MKTASVVASISRQAGGLFESVRRLHQELALLPGVSVNVLSLRDRFTNQDIKSWAPLPVQAFRVLGPAPFGFSPRLNRALLALDEEILHTHGIWMYPSVAVSEWHRRTRRPYLISPHGMLDPWAVRNSAWKKRVALWLYESQHLHNAACIRALCFSEAESARKFGLKNPICVIPNGVDVPEDGEQRTEDRGQKTEDRGDSDSVFRCNGVAVIGGLKAEGRKVLLYLGRIHPKKGLVNLVRAWSEVQKYRNTETQAWTLAIAGWDQGGHEAELKRLATELGMVWADARAQWTEDRGQRTGDGGSVVRYDGGWAGTAAETPKYRSTEALKHPNTETPPSVVFLGPQFNKDKEACYRNCDAFVLPSLSEGLPMAVLEAWAYAKPVLMTAECNLPEGFVRGAAIRIETGASVLRCSGGSVLRCNGVSGTIESGLRELFAMDRNSRSSMGERGRALVLERFSWPKIAAEVKRVYEWVLGGGQPPSCLT